jgi:deoxyribodipyrimidine photo-lyase
MSPVPQIRIRKFNNLGLNPRGEYVLYWMIANRRLRYNFSLDRALEYCESLRKPLVVFEALRVAYPWASDRLHRFVLDGMADNARKCASVGIAYYPYIEPTPGAGKGLLAALAEEACVVITDDFPCFFLPKMIARAGQRIRVLLEAVDSNGLLPIHATNRAASRAFDFRRYLQKELPSHLQDFPVADPFRGENRTVSTAVPGKVLTRWPMVAREVLVDSDSLVRALPIDHGVGFAGPGGGSEAAGRQMDEFLGNKFERYAETHNDPDDDGTSELSAYLHFGHLSAHELFANVAGREGWRPGKLSLRVDGKREGWWNMSAPAEAFLDQVITWRELGYNFAAHRPDYDRYESLPDWAQRTLQKHTRDEREHVYALEQFENAQTADVLWNAAQRQLLREGRIHNYLRMLWGKKILEWTRAPQEALQIMIHLNNKYALDGRDANSYSGIFWILGRYDRPWGPERPIFGTVRYMSSANTARKVSVRNYLRKFGPAPADRGEQPLRLF